MRVSNYTVKQVIDVIAQSKKPLDHSLLQLDALQMICDVDSDLSQYLRDARRQIIATQGAHNA